MRNKEEVWQWEEVGEEKWEGESARGGGGGERMGGGGVTILGCKTMARFPSPRCLNIFTIFGHRWSQ